MNEQKQIVPSTLLKQISKRIETLKYVIRETERILRAAPDGKIHVSPGTNEGNYRYFVRTDGSDKTGTYLHKKEEKRIRGLCQKRYYEGLLKKSKYELNLLENLMKKYAGDSLLSSYTSLSEGIKCQVNPVLMDNESYARVWLAQEYAGLGFDETDKSEHYTDKGERVRSKSEIIIANYLYHHNIPYLYERPITFKNGRTVYPDFTILDVYERREKYLEHLGKLGDMDYVMRNIQKINEYKENGIYLGVNLFITHESASMPVSVKDIENVLKGMGIGG